MADILKPFRALSNWLLGEDDHHIPPLPQGLPDDFAATLERHVRMLVEFQNTEYATLYLERLGRFHHRHGVGEALFHDIADLLAVRMSFNDPIRVAQVMLGRAALADAASIDLPAGLYRPEVQEFVAMFPRDQAELIGDGLTAVKLLRGRMRIHVDRAIGRLRLRFFLWFRRIRPGSLRYARESSSTERWLHMIDRALTKQPSAVAEVVHSVKVISGHGAGYRLALANWNLIINSLAKPVFDGNLVLPRLAEALGRARGAAMADASGDELRKIVAEILSTAEPAAPQRAVGS